MKDTIITGCYEVVDDSGRLILRTRSRDEALTKLPEGGRVWKVRRSKMLSETESVETIFRRLVARG
ncbi:MAG: hypothetical protein IJY15_15220 [Thermoguttaceae bacterium]|nr:hypothetical protein [Thermoguttaceae bacterium]